MTDPALRTALTRGPAPFPALAARYLEEYLAKIRIGIGRLDESQLWWRPREGTNSVGNLLLHLRGNLTLWILRLAGGQPIERDRAGEFSADGSHRARELLSLLSETIEECRSVLNRLGEDDLSRPVTIQGYETDVLGAVFHAVEHTSYHTGQILWIVKQLTLASEPFELYPQHAGE